LPKPQSIAELSKKGSVEAGINTVDEHISESRLKELSSEIYSPQEPGFISTLFKLFLIILFGFLLGILMLPLFQSFLEDGDPQDDFVSHRIFQTTIL